MKHQNNQHRQTILLAAMATMIIFAAFNSTFAQGIGAKYGSRDPRTCADKTSPKTGAPSPAQAAQYVVCSSEHVINDLYLIENVAVQVGKGRPYNIREDINFPDIDTKFPVYPIRGSLTKYDCGVIYLDRSNLSRNCSVYDQPNAKGACYKDSFGDWRCAMTDASGQLTAENQPPPGATATTTKDTKTAPNNQSKVEKQAENKDENDYAKPDFSALEKWFEIIRYEYVALEKTMYVYLKPKVDYHNRPTEFQMEFRDKDGILLQDREVSYFHQMPGTNEGAIGETVKVYVTTPTEKNLGNIVSAKVVRIVK